MSQCDRVLAILQDGHEHDMRDIHRAAGFMRLNSRVAELRARGHNIQCRRVGDAYLYRLCVEPPAPSTPFEAPARVGGSTDGQLALDVPRGAYEVIR